MYTRIVVPLDGSDLAEQALPHAEALARITNLPLHLIRVVDIGLIRGTTMAGMGSNGLLYAEVVEAEKAAADDYLCRMQMELGEKGIRVTTDRRTGPVVGELLAARDGDLYVIASHGRGGLSRLFLGSVAEEITRRATVPVMVIRAQPAQPKPSMAEPALSELVN